MTTGLYGVADQAAGVGKFNALYFLINQILNRANFATLVQIVNVSNDGDLSPVGFVDVQPLVNQLDGQNNAVPHGVVYNLPYMRLQGGSNAIILDPQVGDIGVAIFADRDISSVKANKGQANPGSKRRNDMADGMYFGGLLNDTPTQYVQFNSTGIDITSPTKITLSAPSISITGATVAVDATTSFDLLSPVVTTEAATSFVLTTPLQKVNGNISATGSITDSTATGNASTIGQLRLDFDSHYHPVTGIQTGTGSVNSGGPSVTA